MAVRLKLYYPKLCKGIDCCGKKGEYCPDSIPINKLTKKEKKCSAWLCELFDERGKWQSLSYPDVRTESDAEKRLAVLIAERERGNLGLVIKGRKKKQMPTIAEFGKEYLSLCDKNKYNTYHAKETSVKILTQFLGNYKLSELTTFHVRRFRIDRQKQDNVKPATINLDIAILRNLLNLSIEKGIIEKNPCSKLKTLTVSQTRDRLLSDTEIQLVFDSLTGTDRLMVLLGMLGGLRLNETLKLTWDDFDFQNNLLIFVQSKTGKKVELPLSNLLIEELRKFSNRTEGQLFEEREISHKVLVWYSTHFSNLFKELGIDRYTYHNLRHQCVSMCSEVGTSITVTQDIVRHANVTQTMKYTHTQLDAKRTAIDAISDRILKATKKVKVAS